MRSECVCVRTRLLFAEVANWCVGITLEGDLNILRYTMLLFIVYEGQLSA